MQFWDFRHESVNPIPLSKPKCRAVWPWFYRLSQPTWYLPFFRTTCAGSLWNWPPFHICLRSLINISQSNWQGYSCFSRTILLKSLKTHWKARTWSSSPWDQIWTIQQKRLLLISCITSSTIISKRSSFSNFHKSCCLKTNWDKCGKSSANFWTHICRKSVSRQLYF